FSWTQFNKDEKFVNELMRQYPKVARKVEMMFAEHYQRLDRLPDGPSAESEVPPSPRPKEAGGAEPSHPALADPKVKARSQQSAGLAEEMYRAYLREHGYKPADR
ncbi:unnamed protein product, partial [Symbiodinium pilosum]